MTSARFNSIQFTLLFVLGLFLVVENFSGFLHVLRHPEFQRAEEGHFLIGIIPAALTALLSVALFNLVRVMAREGGQRQTTGQPLGDQSGAQDGWLQTFNTMTDFVSVHDQNFKIVRANSALCEFLGKKPEEIIGRYCYQLFHDQDSPVDGCPHAKAQEIGHAVTMEITDPHLGVPLLITCSPFVAERGDFAGSVHMARIQTAPPASHSHKVDPHHFIPICASCKDIRDASGNWVRVEDYVRIRFNGQLTHSLCKECQKKIYPQFFQG